MTTAMIEAANRSLRHRRATFPVVATALFLLLVAFSPAGALGATTTSNTTSLLGVHVPTSQVPASARVHGTTTTQAPPATIKAAASATQAPVTTTPASGSQPGTVPPTSSVPTTAVPPTTVPGSTATTPATAVPTSPSTSSSTTVVGVAHKAAPKSTRLSTLALALAVLGALLALGCIVWVLSRWLALEPRWTISLMHSLREASYRGSATWAEFSDWARIGR
jgi:hypothetical protein